MTATFNGTSGALAVGANTVGATQVVDGSLPQSKLVTPLLVDASVRPMFSAYANASTTIGVADTKIAFQVEEFDTTNAYDSTTNYRFAPQVQGYYQVVGAVSINGAVQANSTLVVYKTGVLFKQIANNNSNTAYLELAGTAIIYLNGTTDYVELFARTNGAASLFATAYQTYFQAALISRSA